MNALDILVLVSTSLTILAGIAAAILKRRRISERLQSYRLDREQRSLIDLAARANLLSGGMTVEEFRATVGSTPPNNNPSRLVVVRANQNRNTVINQRLDALIQANRNANTSDAPPRSRFERILEDK